MENWKKNLVVVWISQFLAMSGMSAIVPFLPLYIRELGKTELNESAYWSGLIFAAPFLISFITTPLWGIIGDKYGRKYMMLRAIIGLAIAQLLIAFSQNVMQLFLLRVLQGAISGFYPASLALIAANTPKEKTTYALGVVQSANTSGNIIGPLIGGVLANVFGFRNVFIIVAAALFVTSFFVLKWIKEETIEEESKSEISLKDNLDFVKGNKSLQLFLLFIFLSSFGVALIRPIFVFYVESYGIESKYLPTLTGILFSLLGIFSAISSFVLGKRVEVSGMKNVLIFSSLLTGAMYIIQCYIYSIGLLIGARILLGIGYGLLVPLLFSNISSRTTHERMSGVMGIASSSQILGNLLGPISSGTVAAMIGIRYPFIIAGSIFILMSAMMFYGLKKN